MKFYSYLRSCLLFFLFIAAMAELGAAEGISYSVDFKGVKDPALLKTIKAVSQLTTFKKKPPPSINALRYRADSDIPEILKVLHAHGFLEAKVTVRIKEIMGRVHAIVLIDTGPIYTIEDFEISLFCKIPEKPVTCSQISLSSIGVTLGSSANAQKILDAQSKMLQLLGNCGYPLATIDREQFIADGATKSVRIKVSIDTGALSKFGKVSITGLEKASERFIMQKIAWKEGDIYNSSLVEKTQNVLIDTGLFGSVLITHNEEDSEAGHLPMRIEVTESKHRSVNIGASYQTYYGPGLTFGWENRNIAGMGRKLSLQGDITKRSHTGVATYLFPNFGKVDQNFVAQALAMHEDLKAYSMRSYSALSRLDRKVDVRKRFSMGVQAERLYVTESFQNGNYVLLELPFYFRWSSANDLLNPTKGATLEYQFNPSVNTTSPKDYYLTQEVIQTLYNKIAGSDAFVIAQKFTFGTMFSQKLNRIPLSKRFFGGSEDELRGYLYQTVSPLRGDNKPIGGRCAVYYSFEMRFRMTKSMGLVPFFDLGNVYTTMLPTWHTKWFKSVGIGYRYFCFLGPLRFDFAFPLDRRKGLDPTYKLLVSIGQAF